MSEDHSYPECPYCGKAIVSPYFEGSYEGHVRVCSQIDEHSTAEHIIHVLETEDEGAPLRVLVQRDRLDSILSRKDVDAEAKERTRRFFEEKDACLQQLFSDEIMEIYGAYVQRMNLLYDGVVKLDLTKRPFEAFLAQDMGDPSRKTAMIGLSGQFYSIIYS